MSKALTKEEIQLKERIQGFFGKAFVYEFGGRMIQTSEINIYDIVKDYRAYADQQTQPLYEEISHLKAENSMIADCLIVMQSCK